MFAFDWKRAAIMTASGGFFAWAGASVAPPSHSLASPPAPPRVETPTAAKRAAVPAAAAIEPLLNARIPHLHDWTTPAVEPVEPGRDAFAFKRIAPPRPAAPLHTAPPSSSPPAWSAAARPAPTLRFVGVADDFGSNEAAMAIITGGGQLFLVRAGDAVTDRYRVAAVSAFSVELEDVRLGTTLRLTLR
jgi:hypothetical protein